MYYYAVINRFKIFSAATIIQLSRFSPVVSFYILFEVMFAQMAEMIDTAQAKSLRSIQPNLTADKHPNDE